MTGGTSTRRTTSINWPVEVDERLRLLADLTERHLGRPVSAARVLAALVCAAPLDPSQLARLLHAYTACDLDSLAAETARHRGQRTPRLGRPRRSGRRRGSRA